MAHDKAKKTVKCDMRVSRVPVTCHVTCVTHNFCIFLMINSHVKWVTWVQRIRKLHVTWVTWVQKFPNLQHVTYVTGISQTFFSENKNVCHVGHMGHSGSKTQAFYMSCMSHMSRGSHGSKQSQNCSMSLMSRVSHGHFF